MVYARVSKTRGVTTLRVRVSPQALMKNISELLLERELAKDRPDPEILELLLMVIYPDGPDPAQDMVSECLVLGGTEVTDEQNQR